MNILIWIWKLLILIIIILLAQLFLVDPITNKIYEYRLKRKEEEDKELKEKIEFEVKKQLIINKKLWFK